MERTPEEARRDYRLALELPFTKLIGRAGSGVQASRAGDASTGWRIPGDQAEALRNWGVPVFAPDKPDSVLLAGAVQAASGPEIESHDLVGYRLGRFWEHTVAAVEPDGRVVGFPDELGDVVPFNSSVRAFVEIAWRWYFAQSALLVLYAADDEQLGPMLQDAIDKAHAIDPCGAAQDPDDWWWEGVIGTW
ncbi:SUKH-4 family immunity protein [Streptomyces sp. NPDC001941]|uniref:SUKH-4 family immunity protein n=1 Tax=Streptomyces sp. NPDC001941 TaxID=3154659 RepID=UPI00332918B8